MTTTARVTKEQWVEMFRAIGLDEATMHQWHREFESRHPDGHQAFLEWIDIPAEEIVRIRGNARK